MVDGYDAAIVLQNVINEHPVPPLDACIEQAREHLEAEAPSQAALISPKGKYVRTPAAIRS